MGLLKSGDVDAKDLVAEMGAGDVVGRCRTGPRVAQYEAEVRVWDVLTVDLVDGRIQTGRIVRNSDKLAHL